MGFFGDVTRFSTSTNITDRKKIPPAINKSINILGKYGFAEASAEATVTAVGLDALLIAA